MEEWKPAGTMVEMPAGRWLRCGLWFVVRARTMAPRTTTTSTGARLASQAKNEMISGVLYCNKHENMIIITITDLTTSLSSQAAKSSVYF